MSINLNYVAWENSLKGRTIRKPIGGEGGGGGGAGEVQKIFAQGKIKWEKKIHARQLTLKNIHAMA